MTMKVIPQIVDTPRGAEQHKFDIFRQIFAPSFKDNPKGAWGRENKNA